MSHPQSTPTLLQRLGLSITLLPPLFKAFTSTLITTLLQGSFTLKSFRRTFRLKYSQHATNLPLLRLRALQPTTGQIVQNFCASQNLTYTTASVKTDDFPPGTLYFVSSNPESSSEILLYFHGGGYAAPLSSINILKNLHDLCTSTNRTLVILEYTLTPEAKYPVQLAQATASLSHLLKTRSLSQIIMGGDSAGGNLALGLLAHLQTPHPKISPLDEKIPEDDNFKAVFCVSPRTGISATARSYTSNADKDVMSKAAVKRIGAAWQPDETHVWAVPLHAGPGFWEGIRTDDVLLVAGADEVYLDDIVEFAGLIGAERVGGGRLSGKENRRLLVVCEGEFHDQWAIDLGLGIGDGEMTRVLEEWVLEVGGTSRPEVI